MNDFKGLSEDTSKPNVLAMNQPTMQLTEEVINLVKKNKRIRSLLALATNKTEYTIMRWANENNDNLTKVAAIQIIKAETGLPDSKIWSKRKKRL